MNRKAITILILFMFLFTSFTTISAADTKTNASGPLSDTIKPIWVKHCSREDYNNVISRGEHGYDMAIDDENNYLYISGDAQGVFEDDEFYFDNILIQYNLNDESKNEPNWYRILGEKGDFYLGSCVIDVDVNGYIYVTYVNKTDDIVLSKYDSNGNNIKNWPVLDIPGIPLSLDIDDNFIFIIGETSEGSFLITYDTNGTYQWEKTSERMEGAYTITIDNGYVYVACTRDPPEDDDKGDVVLFKYDTDGNYQWEKLYDGSLWDMPSSIAVYDEYLYLTGVSGSLYEAYNTFLLKYDLDGNQIWSDAKIFSEYDENNINSPHITHSFTIDDNHIFITGEVQTKISSGFVKKKAFLLKYDTDGNFLWKKTWPEFSGTTSSYRIKSCNNCLYLTGTDSGEVFLLKCSYDGDDNNNEETLLDLKIDTKFGKAIAIIENNNDETYVGNLALEICWKNELTDKYRCNEQSFTQIEASHTQEASVSMFGFGPIKISATLRDNDDPEGSVEYIEKTGLLLFGSFIVR